MPSDLSLTAAAYAFLVLVAFCRGSATYALGRWVRRTGDASRWARRLERPMFRRSERLVGRFGPPAVSASFMTVGLQSAMNLTAGFLRMPLRHYLPAVAVGALIWAGMYLSVGIAFLAAASSSSAGSALLVVVLILIVAGLAVVVRRRWLTVATAD